MKKNLVFWDVYVKEKGDGKWEVEKRKIWEEEEGIGEKKEFYKIKGMDILEVIDFYVGMGYRLVNFHHQPIARLKFRDSFIYDES